MRKLRLSLDELQVETFELRPASTDAGTVAAHAATVFCGSEHPSCEFGSCNHTVCGSCGEPTCGWSCGPPNYGCASIDPRCTYGDVYPC